MRKIQYWPPTAAAFTLPYSQIAFSQALFLHNNKPDSWHKRCHSYRCKPRKSTYIFGRFYLTGFEKWWLKSSHFLITMQAGKVLEGCTNAFYKRPKNYPPVKKVKKQPSVWTLRCFALRSFTTPSLFFSFLPAAHFSKIQLEGTENRKFNVYGHGCFEENQR